MTDSVKPFSLPVQLVKSQIFIQRLLKKQNLEECTTYLQHLKSKYEWIQNPLPVELQKPVSKRVKRNQPQRFEIEIADEEPEPAPVQKQVLKPEIKPDLTLNDVVSPLSQKKVRFQEKEPEKSVVKTQATEKSYDFDSVNNSKIDKAETQKSATTYDFNDPMALLAPDGSKIDAEEVVPCEFCGRRFGASAMAKHVGLCLKNPDRKSNVKKPAK
ncbi:C2HC-type_zinc-finger domain-containing protein [Hexamita inflata]|uniref:C2HC-type zinc-finger domain-containing protein n=1 Tax=Hexamita inflata TaxID=28002 RepID=A0AA86Q8S4_9EUKA|nr:C2HC-type zinc-finger domain-containing protein [Hexamita inflata]